MNDRFVKKNNNTIKMLIIGLVILVFCLSVCLFLVSGLNEEYKKEVSDEFLTHHMGALSVVDSKITNVRLVTEGFADKIANSKKSVSKNDLVDDINILQSADAVSYAFYISKKGDIYYNGQLINKDANISKADWTLIKSNFDLDKGSEFIVKADFGDGPKKYLMELKPLERKSKNQGYVLVAEDMTGVFDEGVFEYLGENGEGFLINSEGHILIAGNPSIDGSFDDLYGYLNSTSNGKEETLNNIAELKMIIVRNEAGYITYLTDTGYNCNVSLARLSDNQSYYLVSRLEDNLIEDRMEPFIIKSVLACIIVLFMMIVIIFYVWYNAKKTNITIERLAYMDAVTEGKNANYFKEFAAYSVSEFKEMPFAIYRFDILNFRYINEAYGHIRADGVLKLCIKCFEEVFSERELCVRMNADQFLALVVNDRTLEQKLKQFNDNVNKNARGLGVKYPIKFRMGICQVKKHEHNIDILIDHANVARKTIIGDEKVMKATYSDKIVNDMRKVDRIESEQQKALATDEFKVFLQPKWNIRENRIAGAEALVRWIKADGSMVYPDEFIPVFGNNGFIEKLDFYMLERVCADIQELMLAGKPVYPVSVNQSRLLLHSTDYVKNVEKIIKQNNIPAGLIELEITETVFETERDNMIKIMNELKAIGVKLSMDDFGSGYSSLNMLKDAPFDIIKIDRGFFSESVTSESSLLILQKIVEMADGLSMQVICEGVETGEQVVILQTIGCSYVQGYYYSKPIPADDYYKYYCGYDR